MRKIAFATASYTPEANELHQKGQELFFDGCHASAAKLFQQAVAESGHGQSANMLAYIHLYGMGVEINQDLSTQYALIAHLQGVHWQTVPVDALLKTIFMTTAKELLSEDQLNVTPPQDLVPHVMRHIRASTQTLTLINSRS
jgi:hypothetical protein